MQHQNGLRLYTASMLVWLLLCGCGVTNAGNEVELEGTAWHLETVESVEGEIIFTPPSPEFYWIEFSAVDSVKGQDECNSCEGTYELGSGRSISFRFFCTEMGCGIRYQGGIGYGDRLRSATAYELKDGRLRISYSMRGNEGVLVHRAES